METETLQPLKITIDKSKLLSIPDYAKKIGQTRQYIWRLCKSGDLKSIEVCGKFFVVIE